MKLQNNIYVIGVDGGGTKTVAALADLNSKILKTAQSGPSNPRNVGIKTAARNISEIIRKVLPKNKIKIASVFIGLPAIGEEFWLKIKEITKAVLKDNRITKSLDGKLTISSDQLVAFRSGTDEKYGIVLIAGTGCVAHGWKREKECKSSGWGWLADEGSAFWIGQRVFQAVLKDLDGRGPKTLLTDSVFKKFRIKKRKVNLLNQKIYTPNFINDIASFSIECNLAAEKGDKIAKNILVEAGKELAISVKIVIKELNFFKKKFPLVLVGRVLNSKIVLNTLKREIKKIAPKTEFIVPEGEPVFGAVKLAIETIKQPRQQTLSPAKKNTNSKIEEI